MTNFVSEIKMSIELKKKILKLGTNGQKNIVEEKNFIDKEDKDTTSALNSLSKSSSIGFAIALPILAGAIIGSYLDSVFKSTPKTTVVLIILGMFCGLSYLFKMVKDN